MRAHIIRQIRRTWPRKAAILPCITSTTTYNLEHSKQQLNVVGRLSGKSMQNLISRMYACHFWDETRRMRQRPVFSIASFLLNRRCDNAHIMYKSTGDYKKPAQQIDDGLSKQMRLNFSRTIKHTCAKIGSVPPCQTLLNAGC